MSQISSLGPPATSGLPTTPNTACPLAFPDQAGTPPVPVPYPDVASASAAPVKTMHPVVIQSRTGVSPQGSRQLATGQPLSSLADQQRIQHAGGLKGIPMTSGDEAGVNGGVMSGTMMGRSKHVMGSMKVFFSPSPAGVNNPAGQLLAPSQSKVFIAM